VPKTAPAAPIEPKPAKLYWKVITVFSFKFL